MKLNKTIKYNYRKIKRINFIRYVVNVYEHDLRYIYNISTRTLGHDHNSWYYFYQYGENTFDLHDLYTFIGLTTIFYPDRNYA